jgi:hypothetical protein
MKKKIKWVLLNYAAGAYIGAFAVSVDTSADRVTTPLSVDMVRNGSFEEVAVSREGYAEIEIDVMRMALGHQKVSCVLYSSDGKKIGGGECGFTRTEVNDCRVWIDRKGRTIVDGKAFFPLGMYWGKVEADKLEKYAEGPFNCLMPYTRATREHLDMCGEKGLMAFINLKNETLNSAWARRRKITSQKEVDDFFEAEINKVKDHPALLAWYVNDEAPTTEIPERTHLYSLFRRLDPNHPTWAVLDRLHDLREFIPT